MTITQEQIDARIAALNTLQPGDLIVSSTGNHIYTCEVTSMSAFPAIGIAWQARSHMGDLAAMETRGYTHANNLAGSQSLRIHRATEGAL